MPSAAYEAVRAYYPPTAEAAAASVPVELVTHERKPPPNPLLEREYARVGAAGAVVAEPPTIHFAGIEGGLGSALSAKLRLVNKSGHPVRMHIMPPSTSFFSMAVEKRGRLMPGLAEEITIRFTPNEVRYYHDTIKVHLGDGDEQLLVPIHAYPAVADFEFPGRVDFGLVAQGQSSSRVLPLRSPDGAEFDFRVDVLTAHPDFAISPLEGLVPAHGEAGVLVTFTPSRLATAHAVIELHVAQLNLPPKTVQLVGSSAPLQVKEQTLARLAREDAARRATLGQTDVYGAHEDDAELGGLDGGRSMISDGGNSARGDAADMDAPVRLRVPPRAAARRRAPPPPLPRAFACRPLPGLQAQLRAPTARRPSVRRWTCCSRRRRRSSSRRWRTRRPRAAAPPAATT